MRVKFNKQGPAAGTVRELDATQALRACHVGEMFDARLEINIYRLLHELDRNPGPWIGAPVELSLQPSTFSGSDQVQVLAPPQRAAFSPSEPLSRPEFLSLLEGGFAERDSEGRILAEARFEYVLPRLLSNNTLVVLPVVRTQRGVFLGVEHRDLLAVQSFQREFEHRGGSGLAVAVDG